MTLEERVTALEKQLYTLARVVKGIQQGHPEIDKKTVKDLFIENLSFWCDPASSAITGERWTNGQTAGNIAHQMFGSYDRQKDVLKVLKTVIDEVIYDGDIRLIANKNNMEGFGWMSIGWSDEEDNARVEPRSVTEEEHYKETELWLDSLCNG